MELGKYVVKIYKDTSFGLPPSWFWSVSWGSFVSSNVAFTRWGAKYSAARCIDRLEKRRLGKKEIYEVKL